ncbi:MAG: Hsp70 family protein, partial [Verrucomicrobiia bacterium]
MSEFKPFLDLATPEVYEQNAFRLLEAHVEATDRDLSKRKQMMEVAARTGLNAQASPHRIFPRKPAPDEHEIRTCSHAIQDAERRLAHEFFWFWPLVPGKAAEDLALRQLNQGDTEIPVKTWRSREHLPTEGPASKHNLAVLYHFAALRVEREFLNGKGGSTSGDGAAPAGLPNEEARISDAEVYWAEAFRYWNMVAIEQNCWSRVASRIRAMDDRSLTTGTARRMEETLPVALALMTVRLAIRFFQAGKLNHAQRHVARLRASGLAAESVEEALRIAVEPARSSIKTLCDAAKAEAERNSDHADSVAERLLDQTADALALLDFLSSENSPARIAEHDQVALTALGCCILFGNKTLNWKRALELQDMLASLAASTAVKDRISHNRAILQDNFNSTVWWFCGQNQGDEKCAVEVKMHGDVQRMPAMISIGGGTFDAALIHVRDGMIRVENHGGDKYLGGKDIDYAVVDDLLAPAVRKRFLVSDFYRKNERHRGDFAKLKKRAEEAKIRLSRSHSEIIDLSDLGVGKGRGADGFDFELTRGDLEALAEPFIAKSINICRDVLAEARLNSDDVEKLLLVGGPTLMPYLRQRLADRARGLGIALEFSEDPVTVVARGAAVFAATQQLAIVGAPAAGEYNVNLDYKAIGPDIEPLVSGQVVSASDEDMSKFTIEFVNKDASPPWRSGRIGLSPEGRFMATLWAEKGRQNTFIIELLDSAGRRQTVKPESFPYTVGGGVVSNQPLIHSIGVALADNTV